MTNQVEAEKAISVFSNHYLDNREIVVNIARPREERGDRRRGGHRCLWGGGLIDVMLENCCRLGPTPFCEWDSSSS
ncbi:MAG: hypothetical protein V3S81_07695 [Anaerolineales bacterium]